MEVRSEGIICICGKSNEEVQDTEFKASSLYTSYESVEAKEENSLFSTWYSRVIIITYFSVPNGRNKPMASRNIKKIFYSVLVEIFSKVVAFYRYLEKL